jgi:hypothetical protein
MQFILAREFGKEMVVRGRENNLPLFAAYSREE